MNVENRESGIHGMGVFAKDVILKGDWQYVYGMITPAQSVYGFEIDGVSWWEPFPPFRYTNHDDDPNCDVFDEDGLIIIEAKRDIKVGEEITIDYGEHPDDESETA